MWCSSELTQYEMPTYFYKLLGTVVREETHKRSTFNGKAESKIKAGLSNAEVET